jgi:hypothetical protein
MQGSRWVAGLAAGIVLALAGTASATLIDFTGSAFAGANGLASYSTTIDGVGVTLVEATPEGSKLTQSASGLGIDGPNWNIIDSTSQIDVPEQLVVTFDQAQFVQEIYVSELYRESGWLGKINETGWYRIDGGDAVWFQASGDASGDLAIAVGKTATSITFGAKLVGGTHDYALAGINVVGLSPAVTAIPEPLSMGLLAIGGIVVGAAVRRRVD